MRGQLHAHKVDLPQGNGRTFLETQARMPRLHGFDDRSPSPSLHRSNTTRE